MQTRDEKTLRARLELGYVVSGRGHSFTWKAAHGQSRARVGIPITGQRSFCSYRRTALATLKSQAKFLIVNDWHVKDKKDTNKILTNVLTDYIFNPQRWVCNELFDILCEQKNFTSKIDAIFLTRKSAKIWKDRAHTSDQ